ncbi:MULTISPECIES: acyltransferase [unclassified Fibrobacter]|uniref:acyltransferase family protein n=1 Tax=unclassified Fibrobacter TaxID=2634177 RepID=UPI00091DA2A1|nr:MULTISPECIES: acyltransferase [unclassified Fibrobacter]SHK79095.1 Peptidoglycan/LPS O-acetylase OafA/YrhL, contains acyltransferase and SGNH-hydrolase domains [Fibrobacter sp. UWB12]SIO40385.1 Peptidoglycan/LPS O-acetylase OafA/YrhL, contains acyltransferase and SGNH-hydrolase domains [Fibrobacter sp. UWB11]
MQQISKEIDNFLTPDDTKIMKGIAIIWMLLHHLWFFPVRIPGGGFDSLFTVFNIPAVTYFGIFGKICVPMFFFFGGYGVYKSSFGKRYDIVGRLKRLYFTYWSVFLVFIPIGFLFFSSQDPYCADPFIYTRYSRFVHREVISNFLGFTSTYNREWWFLISYVFALVTFPFIRAIIDRFSARVNIFLAVVVALLFAHIFPGLKTVTALGVLGNSHMYLRFFCQIAPYAACFWMGAIVARNGLLDRLNNSAKQHGLLTPLTDIAIWCLVIAMRQNEVGDIFDIFFIPVLTVASMDLLNRTKLLKKGIWYIGRQSTYMWLIHSFFCYYFGLPAKIVTATGLAIPSLVTLIVMTYIASILLGYFWKGVGILYQKGNSIKISFKRSGVSSEK